MKKLNVAFTIAATLATGLPPLGSVASLAKESGLFMAAGAICGVVALVLGNLSGSIFPSATGAK